MNQDQKTQQILNQVQTALKRSDDAIKTGRANLAKLDEDLKIIDEKNNKAQHNIDQEIVKIVQDMDEATVQFVKDTE